MVPSEPFPCADEDDAVARLRPGIDGVILHCDRHRAIFLPQVWQQLPDPREFLGALMRKAGLPADGWNANVKLARYTVSKFSERAPLPLMNHERLSRPLVACAVRRTHPVRPVSARLPAARRAARRLLRAPAQERCDGVDDVRALVRILHRSDRKEAAQSFLSRIEGAVVRNRRLQSRLQVLPELGHFEVARDGYAAGRGVAGGHCRRRTQARAAAASRSRTTTPSSSPSTRWMPPMRATRKGSRRSP